jgi:hypothetical protein
LDLVGNHDRRAGQRPLRVGADRPHRGDHADGGPGNDTFNAYATLGADIIAGGEGNDTIHVSDRTATPDKGSCGPEVDASTTAASTYHQRLRDRKAAVVAR